MKAGICLPTNVSIKHLLVVLFGLVASDGIITNAITQSGFGYEANPLLSGFSGDRLLLLKIAGMVLATLVLWDMHRRRPGPAIVISLAAVAFYSGVVFWNVGVYLAGGRG